MLFTRTNLIAAIVIVLATGAYWAFAAAHPNDGRNDAPAVLALTAPLPTGIPAETTLIVGDPTTQWVARHNGWSVPFHIQWAQITGGPAVTEAFHARALDVGSAANMPPIHAVWVGIPVRAIAIRFRQNPLDHPSFVLATAPGARIHSLADLRGKRIAFSPGQVQGEIVLRTLRAEGLSRADVTLVELPSTADLYANALASGVVDVAPIGAGAPARRYLQQYGRQGAGVLRHSPFRDDLTQLYVRTETLGDPGKAAALRAYVALWARAQAWIQANPEEFARGYYVGNQGLSAEDAAAVVQAMGAADLPADWSQAVRLQQASIDLLAAETHQRRFDAATLFDPRFAPVAARAYALEAARGRALALNAPGLRPRTAP